MSRTIRRGKEVFKRDYDNFEEFCRDGGSWFNQYRPLTFEQQYARVRARFLRDHRSGRYGVPRWFRRMHGSKHVRLVETHKLQHHLSLGEWDHHAPESRCRDAKWYWW